jgi:hypothetical protein
VTGGSVGSKVIRPRSLVLGVLVLLACQPLGGDGGIELGGDDDLPAVDPGVTLGDAALTASCDESDAARIKNLSLEGSYDCEENFTVAMTSTGQATGQLRMQLALTELDSEADGPVAGPTPGVPICEDAGEAPTDTFRLDSIQTDAGTCELGESAAVCDIRPLSAGATVDVVLEICPPPQQATVTTNVVLGRLS